MLHRAGKALLFFCLASTASAQIVPVRPGAVVDSLGGRLAGQVEDTLHGAEEQGVGIADSARSLAQARLDRLDGFVRSHRESVEADENGAPARAGEVMLIDPDQAAIAVARDGGFGLIEMGEIEGLGIGYARLAPPKRLRLAKAVVSLRKLLPGRTITADQIHFRAGAGRRGQAGPAPGAPAGPRGGMVGIIDSGALPSARIFAVAGFARGAPAPSAHGQAIVSLLAGAGTDRVAVADVYGTDPAGGDALAIARALAWMAGRQVPVVSISLVGPPNPLLDRAIKAVAARGMTVVAAVGNDGAAAPPAYPASYTEVIAVTGVDGRDRVLFEAGHATHVDFGAPGADLTAIGIDGHRKPLRGTSFAAPLVASRLAAYRAAGRDGAAALAQAAAEARNAGPKTGKGVLCDTCRSGA